jgi:predicted dehydrogenase
VEKPLADTSQRGQELVEEAQRRRLVLMVDHTFVYTGAVRKIREMVSSGELGDIYYYDSVRVNLGLFQHDVDVIWDLAVHDLSIIDYVFQEPVVAVSASGMAHIEGKPSNMAFLTLFFDSHLLAHLHVNWLSPVKVRKTLIGASRKMIVYDDLEASEKIKIYDKGVTVTSGPENRDALYKTLVGYRTGDMWCPKLDSTEALQRETGHFIACVERGETPITDGTAGLRVVKILEAGSQSLAERGHPVELTRAVTV